MLVVSTERVLDLWRLSDLRVLDILKNKPDSDGDMHKKRVEERKDESFVCDGKHNFIVKCITRCGITIHVIVAAVFFSQWPFSREF